MAKIYTIRAGASFLVGDEIRTGGETVELDDDIVALHADKVDRADVCTPDEEVGQPAGQAQ